MTPDWPPNLHPLFVHFPIALLLLAVLTDAVRLAVKNQQWLNKTVLVLYGAGTLGLLAAFLTGKDAIDLVNLSGAATSVAARHEDWGLYTLIFFALFTVLRFAAFHTSHDNKPVLATLIVLFSFAGAGMLWQTGELGAELVYNHGTAVAEVEALKDRIDSMERELAQHHESAGPVTGDDGSWRWQISRGADQILSDVFAVSGESNFTASVEDDDEGIYLEFQPGENQSYLLFDEAFQNLEGRIELNTDSYHGNVMLVHHFQDEENYQYLKIEDQTMYQGQMLDGEDHLLDSGDIETDGWFSLRVLVSGTHFYGYINNQTITHGHNDEMPSGLTGFSFHGEGPVGVRSIEYQPND